MYNIKNLPGQINLQSTLGIILYDLVKTQNLKNIVDVGTWNGMGSTLCIMKALEDKQEKNTKVYSIELYEEMYRIAKENLKFYIDNYNLTLLNGKIAEPDEVYGWFDHSTIDFANDLHAQLWYDKDMQLLKDGKNISNSLPDSIDLLVLDGGEYCTYPEWQKLKHKVKFFALDDTNILKCNKIKQEILENPSNFLVMHNVTSDRNGYLVGVKK